MAGIYKAQPGPGAPTGGTGRDKDGGKERGIFEKERQGRQGTGINRPPIYTPKDDGERGGYVGRSSVGGRMAVANKKNAKNKLVISKNAKKAARQRAGL